MEILQNEDLLGIGVDTGDFNIFSIVTGEMVGNWNFSNGMILQIIYMHFEEKFLIVDDKGRIIIYDHNRESSIELRRY